MIRAARLTLLRLAACLPLALLVLTAQQVILPQRNGLAAVAEIIAPHLFAVTSVALLVLLLAGRGDRIHDLASDRPRRFIAVGLVAIVAVGVVRFGPGMFAVPPAPTPGDLVVRVMSWNLEATGSGVPGLLPVLEASDADVIGLQELDRSNSAAIAADATLAVRYPYRLLRPSDGSDGIGLLSSHPVIDSGAIDDPSAIRALLDLGGGRTLLVVTAHPHPGSLTTLFAPPLPIDFDATQRDASLVRLRQTFVDPNRSVGEPLVLFGDFNTTDREPAFADLSAGLQDAQDAVGVGLGSTWRPHDIEWLPFGLLTIDHVLVGAPAAPLSISPDCTPRGSDHCILRATIEVP